MLLDVLFQDYWSSLVCHLESLQQLFHSKFCYWESLVLGKRAQCLNWLEKVQIQILCSLQIFTDKYCIYY